MKALLKTRWNEMTYIQRMKDDGELGKKPQSKQNINPVAFPPNHLLWYGESTVFWYIDKAPKTSRIYPYRDKT